MIVTREITDRDSGRIYKVTLIECDTCGDTVGLGGDVSDWHKGGWHNPGTFEGETTWYACPDCWAKRRR